MKIDSDIFDQAWHFPSASRPSIVHLVIRQGNHWLCTCEDYTYDSALQPICKHISRIIADALDWPLDSRGRLVTTGL